MDWANERYVRMYTRKTPAWKALPWQARVVFRELIVEADRAGVINVGKAGVRALPAALDLPVNVVQVGINALLEDGCVQESPGQLVIPNYQPAQEAEQSDKQRQAESRARRRERALAAGASEAEARAASRPDRYKSAESGERVTAGHDGSHGVTAGHSVPSLSSLANLDKPDNDLAGFASLSARQRSLLERHLTVALRLWALQDKLRKELTGTRVLKPTAERLLRVAERLEAGATEADCEAVLRKYRADASKNPQWFNGMTNWRPENFDRALGMAGGGASQESPSDVLNRLNAEAGAA